MRMSLLAGAAVLLGAIMPANAQVAIDMTKVTCADYLAMPPADAALFSAWMSGYYNYQLKSTHIDLEGFAKNVANVVTWCQNNKAAPIMSGLQTAVQKIEAR